MGTWNSDPPKYLLLLHRYPIWNIEQHMHIQFPDVSIKLDHLSQVLLTILTQLEIGGQQYLRLLPQFSVTCTLYFHKVILILLERSSDLEFWMWLILFYYNWHIMNQNLAQCAQLYHGTRPVTLKGTPSLMDYSFLKLSYLSPVIFTSDSLNYVDADVTTTARRQGCTSQIGSE